MTRINIDYELKVITCGGCGVTHAIPNDIYNQSSKSGRYYYCPNGCKVENLMGSTQTWRERLEQATSLVK